MTQPLLRVRAGTRKRSQDPILKSRVRGLCGYPQRTRKKPTAASGVYPTSHVAGPSGCHGGPYGNYGCRLAENVTQAVCRDLLADALVRLDRAGFEIVPVAVFAATRLSTCEPSRD